MSHQMKIKPGPSEGFRLPNGGVSQGRPDITRLMAAREAFEATGEYLRSENADVPVPSPERQALKDQANSGKATLRALLGEDVPSGLLSSSTFNRLKTMGNSRNHEEGIVGPADRPTTSHHGPGEKRQRDRLLQTRSSDLHLVTQKPIADERQWSGSPDRPNTASSNPPARAFVRVGQDALEVLTQPIPAQQAAAIFSSSRPGTSQSAFARSGAQNDLNMTGGSAGPGGTYGGHAALGNGGGQGVVDYPVHAGTSMISMQNATADLPTAAIKAVKRLIHAGNTVTVAAIHQRRPPYIDLGPPAEVQLGPQLIGSPGSKFQQGLRDGGHTQAHPDRRPAFKLGNPPPWSKSRSQAAFDTFDYHAKTDGVKYYVSDFTQPARPHIRPPSRGATRYAANVPTMMLKPSAQPTHTVPLVDVLYADEDHTYRMRHSDQAVPLKVPAAQGSARLLPYANDPLRQTTQNVFFP